MLLQELIKGIPYTGNPDDCEITAVTYDSRKVKSGTLFVAIAGFKVDGHDYISQAIDNGAAAILSNGRSPKIKTVPIIQVDNPRLAMSQISAQFYGNPSESMNIVGITGTNGKTSITHILYHILQKSGSSCGMLGSLGFRTPTGMVSTDFTTPESVEIQQMLQTLKMAEVDNVVLEISSHALELHRIDDVDVDIAVFSNLTPDHLDFHGDMESYFTSKMRLFKGLSDMKTAVINIDDSYSEKICSATSAKIITYGMNEKANLHPVQSDFSLHGTRAQLQFREKNISVDTTLIGEYNLSNIMAASAVSLTMGIDPENIEQAVKNLPPIPGRLEHIPSGCPGKVFVDYAHTPDAYEKLFSNLKILTEDLVKIFVVFGCGGDRDTRKRKEMAAIAEKYSTFSFVTMDNPRTESFEKINADIIQGFSSSNYEIIIDRKTAVIKALSRMDDHSILLVLGKGRESYQEIGTEKQPYSDVEIIMEFQHAG